jgi:lysosomal acid lipase/cholesteryl ester hydrolase
VITDDGYILTLHNIPHGRNDKPSAAVRPAVLLQHGLLDCSGTWVFNFELQSLGFILADSGYDVWLGNIRGNTYGMRHTKYNPKTDAEFWNFSFDEMARYDLPAMINHVLNATSQPSLYYIGHSQGTMIGFIQFGVDQALAAKVKLFIALGPVATVGHIKTPLKVLADAGRSTTQLVLYSILGNKQFLTSSDLERWLADKFCNIEQFDKIFCQNILFLFMGPSKYLNLTRVPVYTTHDPAGTSVKNLVHFAQLTQSDKFQMYDFGSAKDNLIHYNQSTPPTYNLRQVKLPVALYYAKDDWLADTDDVKNFIQDWNHLDFVWGLNANKLIYGEIIRLMQSYL